MLVVAGVGAPDSKGTVARMPITVSTNAKPLFALVLDLAKWLFIIRHLSQIEDESCIKGLAKFVLAPGREMTFSRLGAVP